MGLSSLLLWASILSLVMVVEMAWVILARRGGTLAREAVPVAVGVVVATAVLWASVVTRIAVAVVAPLVRGM